MNNSVILGFFVKFFHAVMTFFDNSLFCSLQKSVSLLWVKVTEKSFFADWFKTYPGSKLENSLIYGILCSMFGFFAKIVSAVSGFFAKTSVIKAVIAWYENFFTVSVRGYGVALLAASVGYSVPKLFDGSLSTTAMAVVFMITVVSAAAILVDKSLKVLFSNSIAAKFICFLGNVPLTSAADTVSCSSGYLLCHLAVGLVAGISSAVTGNFYIPVIMLALLGAGALAADYRIGIFAALILMPFLPTMAVVGLVLVSFVFFVLRLMADKNYKFVHTSLDAPLAILALIMFISAVTSFARGNSINIFLVYLAFILSYYLTVNAVRTKRQLYTLIISMLFAGAVVALYGIYQHIFGFAEGTTWTDTQMFEDIKTRVVSTFGNPNVLDEYLLLLIPVAAGYILARPSRFNKLVGIVITGLLSLCMIYTYSRGNWIGLMAAILLFFMFYDGRVVWLGIIAMLFAPLFVPQTVVDRLLSVGDTADTSTSYRVYIWMGTLDMLKDYWLCGIGLGTEAFNMIYPYYSYSGIVAPHSHNLYLQIITENGFMGLAAFIALILTYYRMTISSVIRIHKDKMLKATVTGLAAGMFGYLLQGMFDNVWYNYRIVFMFYIILALTACGVLIAKKEEETPDD
ncbi:MAG: O-antigen ligase family protein [Clostridia bacterium]|nr:O-antigen ligase family protein [Clostridia bacterium]